ncbi:hypothetical protein KC333_g186 [Hortaea werneckii]|nr:hypothetical protein KC333_g186 [Hortaea werneckii]
MAAGVDEYPLGRSTRFPNNENPLSLVRHAAKPDLWTLALLNPPKLVASLIILHRSGLSGESNCTSGKARLGRCKPSSRIAMPA